MTDIIVLAVVVGLVFVAVVLYVWYNALKLTIQGGECYAVLFPLRTRITSVDTRG